METGSAESGHQAVGGGVWRGPWYLQHCSHRCFHGGSPDPGLGSPTQRLNGERAAAHHPVSEADPSFSAGVQATSAEDRSAPLLRAEHTH